VQGAASHIGRHQKVPTASSRERIIRLVFYTYTHLAAPILSFLVISTIHLGFQQSTVGLISLVVS
jgi:hypothetical protein